MIYLDGLSSIIECEYLNESLSSKQSQCNIFVNPENIRYLVGKIAIINSTSYDLSNIPSLLKNSCKIISRIDLRNQYSEVEFQPYILRISKEVHWNGKVVNETETMNEFLDDDLCEFDISNYSLYFPKIRINRDNPVGPRVTDDFGNLTDLGWVLQQVGVNIVEDTPMKDLDIIKTKKILFK